MVDDDFDEFDDEDYYYEVSYTKYNAFGEDSNENRCVDLGAPKIPAPTYTTPTDPGDRKECYLCDSRRPADTILSTKKGKFYIHSLCYKYMVMET